MAHQRKNIRDAIVALLVAADTAAATRVYPNRFLPVGNSLLPAILVYTLAETSDAGQTAPRELVRELDIEIVGLAGVEAAADDVLDALALEIEQAMHADRWLGGEAADSRLTGTDLAVEKVGDRLIGGVTLTYAVTYRTQAPEPVADEDLDDFETVHATYKVDGPDMHADDDAEDEFTVEEP